MFYCDKIKQPGIEQELVNYVTAPCRLSGETMMNGLAITNRTSYWPSMSADLLQQRMA